MSPQASAKRASRASRQIDSHPQRTSHTAGRRGTIEVDWRTASWSARPARLRGLLCEPDSGLPRRRDASRGKREPDPLWSLQGDLRVP